MSEDTAIVSAKMYRVVAMAAGGVVLWRMTALVLVYRQDAIDDSLTLQTLLTILGMVFVACGLLVFRRIPSRASLLFAGFCICSGLHWGGPLDLPPGQLRTGLILFYILVSGFLGSTLLLQFTLCFPQKYRVADKNNLSRFLYAPVIVATVLAAVYLLLPPASGVRITTHGLFMLLHEIVSNLFAVIALALVVSRILRSDSTQLRKRYTVLMVVGMLTAWVPYLIAASVGVDTDAWNLTMVALPISFAVALFGIERARKTSPGFDSRLRHHSPRRTTSASRPCS